MKHMDAEASTGEITKASEDEKIIMNKPRNLRKRCHCCNKRLKMVDQFTCDCGNLFCSKHMHRHSHNCTVDVKTRRQKELVENNPKMEQKMVKI
jgi:predicted nucleic acid binding AN1-type Zn finger protein